MKIIQESGAYELSFKYRFEAAHRFTASCSEKCMTPHGHTWFATAEFRAMDSTLNASDMVMEFAKLKQAWKAFLTETVDHSFMHHFKDPILPVLHESIPHFRGLPFPGDPTTELIAALFFAKLTVMHSQLGGAEALTPSGVLIQETPTNSIAFRSTVNGSSLLAKVDAKFGAGGVIRIRIPADFKSAKIPNWP